MITKILKSNYTILIVAFFGAYMINSYSPNIINLINNTGDPSTTIVFFILSIVFGFGYLANRFTTQTIIPSFVAIMLFGLVLSDILAPTTAIVMQVAMVFANLILYLGGIEIDRKQFMKVLLPTLSIGIVGYIVTMLALGFALNTILGIDPTISYLLGAILGSTDPAALIPTLKSIVFKNKNIVDLSIAESAINDVIGSVVTLILLAKIKTGITLHGFRDVLGNLANTETISHLGKEMIIGIIVGGISYLIINWYEKQKHTEEESNHDIGLLLFVPLAAYTISVLFHGAGFLAAFISGLLAMYAGHHDQFTKTSSMLESKIDVYAKPAIFMLLGPLVDIGQLIDYAWIGIGASLLFIGVVRPLTVFLSLIPLRIFGYKYTIGELGFMCSVRETGVIPVVLLIIVAKQLPELEGLVPIGIWVVLFTLIVLPIMAPWWAKVCKVSITK
jgi:NhaP-type Na+/H+ or K+/H+ antiporter